METNKSILKYFIHLLIVFIYFLVVAGHYLIGLSIIVEISLIIFHYKFVRKNFEILKNDTKNDFIKDIVVFMGFTVYYIIYYLALFLGMLNIVAEINAILS